MCVDVRRDGEECEECNQTDWDVHGVCAWCILRLVRDEEAAFLGVKPEVGFAFYEMIFWPQ